MTKNHQRMSIFAEDKKASETVSMPPNPFFAAKSNSLGCCRKVKENSVKDQFSKTLQVLKRLLVSNNQVNRRGFT